jgi:hypothetical protein
MTAPTETEGGFEMITNDTALEIAREHLREDVTRGGMVTLYGRGDHWVASCAWPRGRERAEHPIQITISMADGSVKRI